MNDHDALRRLARAIGAGMSWLFLVVMAVTAYEVVLRYGFGRPTIWVHDLTIALCAVCFVFGGAYASGNNTHIRITPIHERLPERWRRRVDRLNDFAALAFLAALTYAATIQAMQSIALGETSGRAWDVPMPMLLKSALALGAAFMTLQALRDVVARLRGK